GTIVGTVAYMSPEQLESKAVDFRSDIFSFGVMIYELATGQHPFKGSSPASTIANILTAEPAAMQERNPLVSPELDRIVNKCLRKRPDWRYQSTRDLVVDLENLKYDSASSHSHSAVVATDGQDSLLRQLAQSLRLSPRRWWELNLLSSYAWYALFIFLAWRVRELSGSAWATTVLFVSTAVAVTVLGILRTILVNFALFNPQELPVQVRRFAPWIQVVTLVQAFMLEGMAGEIAQAHPIWAALLAALGAGAFLVAVFYDRMVNRSAFPQLFTKHESAEEILARGKQRLGRIMAAAQFFFASLFALGAFAASRPAHEAVTMRVKSEDSTWLLFTSWGLFALFVLLAIVWAVTAVQMWRRPVELSRTFRRWMLYFLLPASLAVMIG
ncbi:MAG: serine/threonine-protein kinase, partial [Burkholderiales bacterium]